MTSQVVEEDCRGSVGGVGCCLVLVVALVLVGCCGLCGVVSCRY